MDFEQMYMEKVKICNQLKQENEALLGNIHYLQIENGRLIKKIDFINNELARVQGFLRTGQQNYTQLKNAYDVLKENLLN